MSRKPTSQELESALRGLAKPDASPRAIMKGLRKQFPAASKKDIIHAAFGVMIADADSDQGRALALQNFTLSERAGPGE